VSWLKKLWVQRENLPWPFPRAGERGGPRRRVAGRSGCAQLGARAACAAAEGSRRRRNEAARRGAHATWGPPLPANPTTRHGNPLLSISKRAFCFSIYCGALTWLANNVNPLSNYYFTA